MNFSSAYSQFLKKRSQKIYALTDQAVRVYSPAYFHQLRVEIKKMNAVLKLVQSCSADFAKKRIFRPYKQLSKSAGQVREIQLEESVIRKIKQDPFTRKYLGILKEQRLVQRRIFLETKSQVKISLQDRELKILPFANDINEACVARYFTELRMLCIGQMKDEKLHVAAIHELRMLLKEFFYNAEVIFPDAKIMFKKIHLLQDQIGKWHDYSVIIRHLDNFRRRNSMTERNAALLHTARSGISAKASLLFKKINIEKIAAVTELHQFSLP